MRIIHNNGKSTYLHLQIPESEGGGGDADKHYVHDQGVADDVWNITHGLNKFPSVTVVTSAGDEVEGEVTYTGLNTVTLTFSGAFSGKAYLN